MYRNARGKLNSRCHPAKNILTMCAETYIRVRTSIIYARVQDVFLLFFSFITQTNIHFLSELYTSRGIKSTCSLYYTYKACHYFPQHIYISYSICIVYNVYNKIRI